MSCIAKMRRPAHCAAVRAAAGSTIPATDRQGDDKKPCTAISLGGARQVRRKTSVPSAGDPINQPPARWATRVPRTPQSLRPNAPQGLESDLQFRWNHFLASRSRRRGEGARRRKLLVCAFRRHCQHQIGEPVGGVEDAAAARRLGHGGQLLRIGGEPRDLVARRCGVKRV